MSCIEVLKKASESITESEMITSAAIIGHRSNSVVEWFSESEYSPLKYKNNNIVEARCDDYGTVFVYNRNSSFEPENTLFLCSSSIKKCPVLLYNIEYTPLIDAGTYNGLNVKIDDSKNEELSTLLIYGHNEDYNDRFHSMLDDKFLQNISYNFNHKYNKVCLFGCFPSIEGMKKFIKAIYDRMSDKGLLTKIGIYLESKVKDDDGKWRTLADVINSKYIRPTILDDMNIVEFIMKKFDKKVIAPLYTDKIQDNSIDTLFDDDDEIEIIESDIECDNSFFEESNDDLPF